MTDIVERLREYVESTDYINAEPLCAEAADRIAELEQQLARQRLQLEDYALSNIQDRQELAAAQAREKVLRSLSNELLHQIDINDFTDSHGHSAKMLKAVHDVMKYNTQPTDDTTLNNLLAEGQAREKVLMVAIESLVENVDRPPDANCSCHISPPCNDCVDYGGLREAFEWVDTALAMPTDDTTLRAALKAERERCAKVCDEMNEGLSLLVNNCAATIRAVLAV